MRSLREQTFRRGSDASGAPVRERALAVIDVRDDGEIPGRAEPIAAQSLRASRSRPSGVFVCARIASVACASEGRRKTGREGMRQWWSVNTGTAQWRSHEANTRTSTRRVNKWRAVRIRLTEPAGREQSWNTRGQTWSTKRVSTHRGSARISAEVRSRRRRRSCNVFVIPEEKMDTTPAEWDGKQHRGDRREQHRANRRLHGMRRVQHSATRRGPKTRPLRK